MIGNRPTNKQTNKKEKRNVIQKLNNRKNERQVKHDGTWRTNDKKIKKRKKRKRWK